MKICIFGAGSLGSALGWLLADEHEVSLVGRRPHMEAVRRRGLKLMGDCRGTRRVLAYEAVAEAPEADLLVLTVKAYDTCNAVDACRTWTSVRTKVLTIQNGLGNLELLRRWKGSAAFGGTTTMGASLVEPGVVRLSGLGMTTIGSDMDIGGARSIGDAFSRCGIPARTTRAIEKEIWTKAVVSSCINPLTAVLRVPNGKLLESPVLVRIIREVAREGESVASSRGVSIREGLVEARVKAVCRDTSKNRSSMLQDLEKGRRTEISHINGEICHLGDAVGIPVPYNTTLAAMVGAQELRGSRRKVNI